MGKKILLGILGVVLGVIVGGIANMALVVLNSMLHAPPEGLDFNDPEAVRAFAANLPPAGFLLVLAAHSSQAFLGSLVGTLVSGRRSLLVAWIIGGLTLFGCVWNLMQLPSPAWFAALDVLLPLPLAYLGGKLVLARSAPAERDPA